VVRAANPDLNAPVQLVVNADDFGCSEAANEAVQQAHRSGVLTTASLMVNGAAAEEAVAIAQRNPRLGVGLHLVLVCGQSTLGPDLIPGLVDQHRWFSSNPITAGMRYFFLRQLRPQILREIEAQLAKFQQTGLKLDHINGHLNIHLHPVVCRSVVRASAGLHRIGFRLTQDPLRLNLKLASGHLGYRVSHAMIFGALGRWAQPRLPTDWTHTQVVFGLLQNRHVDEAYITGLLPGLKPGNYELYAHPSLDKAPHELAAFTSAKVRQLVSDLGIRLVRYQDLSHV
jgi:chitin disaccharide deacetylase